MGWKRRFRYPANGTCWALAFSYWARWVDSSFATSLAVSGNRCSCRSSLRPTLLYWGLNRLRS